MPKFSPGPWKYDEPTHSGSSRPEDYPKYGRIEDANGNDVVELDGCYGYEYVAIRPADGRLIAKAPQMYVELCTVLSWLDHSGIAWRLPSASRRIRELLSEIDGMLAERGAVRSAQGTYPWAEALAKANPDVLVRRRRWFSKFHIRWHDGRWQWRGAYIGDIYWNDSQAFPKDQDRYATDWEVYEEDSDQSPVASDEGEPKLTRAAMVRDFGEPNINVKLFGEGFHSALAGMSSHHGSGMRNGSRLHYPPGEIVKGPGLGCFVISAYSSASRALIGGLRYDYIKSVGLVECWEPLGQYESNASLYRYVRLVPEWEIPAARDKLDPELRKKLAEFPDAFTPDQQAVLFEPEKGSIRWAREMCYRENGVRVTHRTFNQQEFITWNPEWRGFQARHLASACLNDLDSEPQMLTGWSIWQPPGEEPKPEPDRRVEVPVEWQHGALMFQNPTTEVESWVRVMERLGLVGWRYIGAKHLLPNGEWTEPMRTIGVWVHPPGKAYAWSQQGGTEHFTKLVDGKDRAPDGGPTVKLVFEQV